MGKMHSAQKRERKVGIKKERFFYDPARRGEGKPIWMELFRQSPLLSSLSSAPERRIICFARAGGF